MADGFSVGMSASIGQYGWSTSLQYAEDADDKLPDFPTSQWGDIVATTKSTLGSFPMTVEQYSQAKEVMENGTVKTQIPSPNPQIFISIPPERQRTRGAFEDIQGGGLDDSGIWMKDAQNAWGIGGWTAADIIEVLVSEFNLSLDLDAVFTSTSRLNYWISYHRISPYGSVINEVKRLWSGFPIFFQFKNNRLKARLIAHDPTPINFLDPDPNEKVAVRFVPQRKVQVVVYGDWGQPEKSGTTSTLTHVYEIKDVDLDIYWLQSSYDGNVGTEMSHYIEGQLNIINIDEDDLITQEQFWDNPSSDVLNQDVDSSGQRYEIITKSGQPVITLASITEQNHKKKHLTYGNTKYVTSRQYNATEAYAISYGESLSEVRCINVLSRSVSTSDIFKGNSYDNKYHTITSYSITSTIYEGMASSTGRAYYVPTDTNEPLGRLREKLTIQYSLHYMILSDWYSGNLKAVTAVTDGHDPKPDKYRYIMAETNRRVEIFEPAGISGFNRSVTNIRTTWTTKGAITNVSTTGGTGDPNAYLPQINRTPGYVRIIGRDALFEDGETEIVSLPCVDRKDADRLAGELMNYKHGYYEVTITEDENICDEDDYNFNIPVSPSFIPGELGFYGTVISVNRQISPLKQSTTRTYRRYKDW